MNRKTGAVRVDDAKETEVEDPDALEATRRLTLAWLNKTFGLGIGDWRRSQSALREGMVAIATVIEKKS
ncbi:hypothetical protein [Palleronia marisminoris]|uniref:hypothetical protein n=1 Tax=Palleronia marisminoris TaxID=315423 RepID=UPI000A26B947|nr:hypothetical protein [Palleronia marisminoris]